jgi:hypothetical protein
MPELLGLVELKKRAKAAGYTKISRLGDGGSAVPLDSWDGVTVDAESGDGTSQRILRGAGYRQMEISGAFEGTIVRTGNLCRNCLAGIANVGKRSELLQAKSTVMLLRLQLDRKTERLPPRRP